MRDEQDVIMPHETSPLAQTQDGWRDCIARRNIRLIFNFETAGLNARRLHGLSHEPITSFNGNYPLEEFACGLFMDVTGNPEFLRQVYKTLNPEYGLTKDIQRALQAAAPRPAAVSAGKPIVA